MKSPELLAPAGSLRHLDFAFGYGADAVYAGLPRYSLRVRNNDFDLATLKQGIDGAHARGKRFFLASNIMPHNAKVKTFLADMEPVMTLAPDALIMADPGLMLLVRERWPEAIIHLSVQANTVNYASVRFWQSIGVKRIILSRELSLEEIAEIRQQCPDMELEVFVHGALCIAYSGRCLLSGYFNHRDPNQGTCTNSCRWDYQLHTASETDEGAPQRPETARSYLLEQAEHPGELMPIEEDEHGTYILNSKDLRAVEHVARLVEIGVDSLKIEGRTKSHYYIARTVQAYRKAIDDAAAARPFDTALLATLENLANRGYTDGFYVRHHSHEYQNYMKGASSGERQQFVGEIIGYDAARGMAEVDVKNKFRVGDRMELITPQGNRRFVLERMEDRSGRPAQEAPGGGHRVHIALPPADYRHTLLTRELA